jgi:2-oxoisovalerate dehydrogenase E2 component (dihydrolipoyl transacylase)
LPLATHCHLPPASDDTVIPTTVLNISFACDHRVLDGATVARAARVWKGYVESPELMLADLA